MRATAFNFGANPPEPDPQLSLVFTRFFRFTDRSASWLIRPRKWGAIEVPSLTLVTDVTHLNRFSRMKKQFGNREIRA